MNRLKEIRKKKDLTLKALGEEVGLASNTLSQYENGKREPRLETWQKLASVLNVPIPYLQGQGVSRAEMLNHLISLFYWYQPIEIEEFGTVETYNISELLEDAIQGKFADEFYEVLVDQTIPDELGVNKKADKILMECFSEEVLFLDDYAKLALINKPLDIDDEELTVQLYKAVEEDGFKSTNKQLAKHLQDSVGARLADLLAGYELKMLKTYSQEKLADNLTDLIDKLKEFKNDLPKQ